MDIIKIAALCIISSIMCSLFSKDNKEYSLYIKAAAACMILCGIIIYISPATVMWRKDWKYGLIKRRWILF